MMSLSLVPSAQLHPAKMTSSVYLKQYFSLLGWLCFRLTDAAAADCWSRKYFVHNKWFSFFDSENLLAPPSIDKCILRSICWLLLLIFLCLWPNNLKRRWSSLNCVLLLLKDVFCHLLALTQFLFLKKNLLPTSSSWSSEKTCSQSSA